MKGADRVALEQILISGENDHDADAIRELIRGLRPDLQVKFQPLKTPITLVRGMKPESAKTRNERIAAAIRAANVRRAVRATILHEDADAVEPAHLSLKVAKEAALAKVPGKVVAVVPAWEIETWWFLFPASVAAYRSSWNKLTKRLGKNVGLVVNSKEVLIRELRPSRGSVRDYDEADSPGIAAIIAASGEIFAPRAVSDSWRVFVSDIAAL